MQFKLRSGLDMTRCVASVTKKHEELLFGYQ